MTIPTPVVVKPVIAPGFSTEFAGSDDLLARRSRLYPLLAMADWDRLLTGVASVRLVSETPSCATPTTTLTVTGDEVTALAAAKLNVLFLPHEASHCFKVGNGIALNSTDTATPSTVEAKVERIAEAELTALPAAFLEAMKIEATDVSFLANRQMHPGTPTSNLTIILVSVAAPSVMAPSATPSASP